MSEMLNSLGTNKDSLTVLIVILTFITSIFYHIYVWNVYYYDIFDYSLEKERNKTSLFL